MAIWIVHFDLVADDESLENVIPNKQNNHA
jgi:hypothetical protein